ncbi:effector binding domain-containing protein [Sphingobacterium sp. SRCM116780]|uniref:GyrI-like domain-containing protein n=1 Tax=Sphingobacterium sp. SRCM116780 TaxID=2907623 RepID=UPI001F33A2D0|nr:effector binding domain-containing protein [Sphingobacterium sp. SRCM116780]UIR56466.1 effector binding domain-containing protein [Sphingobacterium sp. SRCM116780]
MRTKNFQNFMLLACLLFSITAQSQVQTKKSKTMNNQIIQKFYVVGISTRTTNENGQSAKDIETLWGKFWNEEIQKQIPNKISDDIYAVYTDYETDFTGPYTTIIGLAVNSLEHIPKGFIGITIETSIYQKFVSKGKMPEAVFNTWLEIWQNKKLNRAYKADFTIHGKKYYDGDQAEVETFISVKE